MQLRDKTANLVAFQFIQRRGSGQLKQAADVARIIFHSERGILAFVTQVRQKTVKES